MDPALLMRIGALWMLWWLLQLRLVRPSARRIVQARALLRVIEGGRR